MTFGWSKFEVCSPSPQGKAPFQTFPFGYFLRLWKKEKQYPNIYYKTARTSTTKKFIYT